MNYIFTLLNNQFQIIFISDVNIKKRNFIYARVSSIKQRGDLERQVQVLRRSYPDYELITDIGSGLNHKRTGFKKILDILFKGDIGEVVCARHQVIERDAVGQRPV